MSNKYPVWVNIYGSELNNLRAKTTAVLAFRATLDGFKVLITERNSNQFYDLTPSTFIQDNKLEVFYLDGVPKERHLLALAKDWNEKTEQDFTEFAQDFDLVFCSCGDYNQQDENERTILAGSFNGLDLDDVIAASEKLRNYSLVGIIPDKISKPYQTILNKQLIQHKFLTKAIARLPILTYELFSIPKSDDVENRLWTTAGDINNSLNLPEKNKTTNKPKAKYINKAQLITGSIDSNEFENTAQMVGKDHILNIFTENPAADVKLKERMDTFIEKLNERSTELYEQQAERVKQVNELTQRQIEERINMDLQNKESRNKQIQLNQEKLTEGYNLATSELNKMMSTVNEQIEKDIQSAEHPSHEQENDDPEEDKSITAEIKESVVDKVVNTEEIKRVAPVIQRNQDLSFTHYIDHDKMAQILKVDLLVSVKNIAAKNEYTIFDINNQRDLNKIFYGLQEKYKLEHNKDEPSIELIFLIALETLLLAKSTSSSENQNLEILIRKFTHDIFTHNDFSKYSLKYWFLNTIWLAENYIHQKNFDDATNIINKLINVLYKANTDIDTDVDLNLMRASLTYLLAKVEDLNPAIAEEDSKRTAEIVDQLFADLPVEVVNDVYIKIDLQEEITKDVVKKVQDAKKAFGPMVK